jgi:DNA-binding response OmpR family regulator
VLYTSGYSGNSIIHNGRLDEGVDLISKPYHRYELAATLRAVLARDARSAA